jgi:large subunit ribosomal protein L29
MVSAAELHELDEDELENRLVEYRRELLNLRFQLATGQLDNVARVSQVRRDVARVLTILHHRGSELLADEDVRETAPEVTTRRRIRRKAAAADTPAATITDATTGREEIAPDVRDEEAPFVEDAASASSAPAADAEAEGEAEEEEAGATVLAHAEVADHGSAEDDPEGDDSPVGDRAGADEEGV